MANPEHVERLKQEANVWNDWREKNPGVQPDFSGAHLSAANLIRANLRAALQWHFFSSTIRG